MWAVDLADLDALPAFVARVHDEIGGIEILVNNAGVPKRRKAATLTLDDAQEVMRINYLSPVALTVAALPAMIGRGHGHVVNVSSMGAHLVAFGTAAYAASKAALEMFTEALYLELVGTGVHPQDPATAVSPATVADAIVACIDDERFLTFATDRDAATAAVKAADPNGFLAEMRERLAGLRG
jgi:NAD(P)-dependent dehydrogenase (short-subunit alcohol dehydrogenase family)